MKRFLAAIAVIASWAAAVSGQAPPLEVEKSRAVGLETPVGLAFDGKLLWAGSLSRGKLAAIDPDTMKTVRTLDAPCFTVGALAHDGSLLWVLDTAEKALFGLDTSSGTTKKFLSLDLPSPQGIACMSGELWVADGGEGAIVRIDEEDGTTFRRIKAPTSGSGRRSQFTGMTSEGGYLFLAERLGDTLYQVDPLSGWVINAFKNTGPYTSGLAFSGGRLLFLDYEKGTIDVAALPGNGKQVRHNPRKENLEFSENYRNFGPGTIEELRMEIAVPSPMVFQDMDGAPAWSSSPVEIREDEWGQKCASFVFKDLRPLASASAGYKVEATLYSVNFIMDPRSSGTLADIPAEVKKMYLKDDTKLDIGNPVIKKAVAEAAGSEKNCYVLARKIYDHIHGKMRYELSGGWNVAPVVLERGTGSCSEYAFVMIAMCRAAGLPARYAGSVVVRGDNASRDDVFHRWVEVFIPPYGWVPVDPSGGDSDVPEEQARCFGALDNRFLITTVGGGGSSLLKWDYNSSSSYEARGPVKLMFLKSGDWSPLAAGRNETEAPAGKAKSCAM